MKKLNFLAKVGFLASFSFCGKALVWDWSGRYQTEISTIQSRDSLHEMSLIHNLHLQPEVVAFEGVKLHSWFHLMPPPPDKGGENHKSPLFYPQDGLSFGLPSGEQKPGLFIRDLYVEMSRDFFLFRMGWKPHHFGLGLFYNEASGAWDAFYPLHSGGRGFASSRFFMGSFFIQPLLYLDTSSLLNTLIQVGFQSAEDTYGMEGLYRKKWLVTLYPLSSQEEKNSLRQAEYFGLYAWYKKESSARFDLELGAFGSRVFAAAFEATHSSPWKWMQVGLKAGLSHSSSGETKSFYFDPVFFSNLTLNSTSFLFSPDGGEGGEEYSFHSGFYAGPSFHFALTKKTVLDLNFLYLSHKNQPTYNAEVVLNFEYAKNIIWSNGISVFHTMMNQAGSNQGPFYMGFTSQAAITF